MAVTIQRDALKAAVIRMATLDTLTIARNLTDAGADPKLADAIAVAVREATEAGDHVTPDQFKGRARRTRGPPDVAVRRRPLAQTAAMAAIMATLLRLFAPSS